MPYPEFYNVNKNIKYPFVVPTTGKFVFTDGFVLQDNAIVDCGFTIGARGQFDASTNSVWLDSVSRVGYEITLRFKCDAAGVISPFLFTRLLTSPFGAVEYAVAGDPTRGVGFLVTGDMSAFSSLSDGQIVYAQKPPIANEPVPYVEPALIVNLRKHEAVTVNVMNWSRPAMGACCATPVPVPGPDDPLPVDYATGGAALQGMMNFKPGYNMTLSINKDTNSLNVSPLLNAGAGATCENAFHDTGSGPTCRDLVYTINGVKPTDNGTFTFLGNRGIYVDTYPNLHLIVIRGELTTQVECQT